MIYMTGDYSTMRNTNEQQTQAVTATTHVLENSESLIDRKGVEYQPPESAEKLRARAYFDQIVCDWIYGDILSILDSSADRAAPLIMVTVNAIDIIGGVYKGFLKDNVGSRTIDALTDIMRFPRHEAEFLYYIIRCGMTHSGIPGGPLIYSKRRNITSEPLTKSNEPNSAITLFAGTLADRWFEGVQTMKCDPGKYINRYPVWDEAQINRLLAPFT
jgi:hypothetical protein